MAVQKPPMEHLLTPAEVAAIVFVDPKTVSRWASAGKIASTRTAGGHRRFRSADVQAILPEGCRHDRPDEQRPVATVRRPARGSRAGIEHELADAASALTEAAGGAAAAVDATTRALDAARRVGADGTVDGAGRTSLEAAVLVASAEAVAAVSCVTRQVEDAAVRVAAAAELFEPAAEAVIHRT